MCKKVIGSSATPLTPLHPRAAAELGNLAPGSRGWVGTRKNKEAGKNREGLQTDPRPLQMELLYVCVCMHVLIPGHPRGGGIAQAVCHSGSQQAITVGPWVPICKAVGDGELVYLEPPSLHTFRTAEQQGLATCTSELQGPHVVTRIQRSFRAGSRLTGTLRGRGPAQVERIRYIVTYQPALLEVSPGCSKCLACFHSFNAHDAGHSYSCAHCTDKETEPKEEKQFSQGRGLHSVPASLTRWCHCVWPGPSPWQVSVCVL